MSLKLGTSSDSGYDRSERVAFGASDAASARAHWGGWGASESDRHWSTDQVRLNFGKYACWGEDVEEVASKPRELAAQVEVCSKWDVRPVGALESKAADRRAARDRALGSR